MQHRYIISILAENRVGFMAAVTNGFDELGGDLQQINQTVLDNFVCAMLFAAFPESRTSDVIVDHLSAVTAPFGGVVSLRLAERISEAMSPEQRFERYLLVVEGEDRPGALRQIAGRLAQDGVDVGNVYARRSGADEYTAIMDLLVPAGLNTLELRATLEQLGSTAGLRSTLQHGEVFAAIHDPRHRDVTAVPGRARLDAVPLSDG